MQVTILTRADCAFCDRAKDVLERLAEEYPLEISTVDMDSTEGTKLALEGGVMFPPGIFIEGRAVCYGRPSERRLRKELGVASAAEA